MSGAHDLNAANAAADANESAALIAAGIARIFADAVDRELIESVRGGAWPEALWRVVEDSGYTRVLDADPAAGNWRDAEGVLFALGYHRAPLPLAETLLANCLCARAGLPVEDGPATVIDGRGLTWSQAGGSVRVSGLARAVPWARAARRLVVAGTLAGQPHLGLLRAAAGGLEILPGSNVAHEPRDTLRLSGVAVQAVPCEFVSGHDPVRLHGALARSVGLAGVAASVLDQSVVYVNDRVQFGRPIGKFQAVQHLLAELGSEAAAGAMAAAAACAVADGPDPVPDIAIAKVRTGQMASAVARIAHQVHGAIGLTREHTLHHGTQRLWAWRAEFGRDAEWAAVIGRRALDAGGAGLWADLLVGREA